MIKRRVEISANRTLAGLVVVVVVLLRLFQAFKVEKVPASNNLNHLRNGVLFQWTFFAQTAFEVPSRPVVKTVLRVNVQKLPHRPLAKLSSINESLD